MINQTYRIYELDEFLPMKYLFPVTDAEDDLFAKEGGVLEAHIQNEKKRSRWLANKAKELFHQKHGRLFCEICEFRFDHVTYGKFGVSFIEAHHDVLHIRGMVEERETRVSEFRMVCSNCHIVLHLMEISADTLLKHMKNDIKGCVN